MDIIGKRKKWFIISGIAVLLAVFSLIFFGLKLGIDFKGGTLFELEFSSKPNINEVKEVLLPLDLGNLVVQPSGENRLIIKFSHIDQQTYEKIQSSFKEKYGGNYSKGEIIENENNENESQGEIENINEENVEEVKGEKIVNTENIEEETTENIIMEDISTESAEEGTMEDTIIESTELQEEGVEEIRYENVGPTVGEDLVRKAIISIIVATICIILYIAWAFRKISKPVKSWKYGICAIFALVHDALITLGIFSILGKFLNIEIDSFFVVALLTIIGYSVNDTVVVFDRVRENLLKNPDIPFEKNINNSVIESVVRSLNSSLTTLFVLFALFLFGGETIRFFVLALIIGFVVGTYSSIFIASPLLVVWRNLGLKFKKAKVPIES